jgi:hypothetical protein
VQPRRGGPQAGHGSRRGASRSLHRSLRFGGLHSGLGNHCLFQLPSALSLTDQFRTPSRDDPVGPCREGERIVNLAYAPDDLCPSFLHSFLGAFLIREQPPSMSKKLLVPALGE